MKYVLILARLVSFFLTITAVFMAAHWILVGLNFWLHDAMCTEVIISLLALIGSMVYADKVCWKNKTQNTMPMVMGTILCFLYMSVVLLDHWWLPTASLAALCYCLYLLEIPKRDQIKNLRRVYLLVFIGLASIIGTYWAMALWHVPSPISDASAFVLMGVGFSVYIRWLSI